MADDLIEDLPEIEKKSSDEKNIRYQDVLITFNISRRRVYDAINVLTAMGIIVKVSNLCYCFRSLFNFD